MFQPFRLRLFPHFAQAYGCDVLNFAENRGGTSHQSRPSILPTGHSPSNLLSPHVAPLEVVVSDITLIVAPGDGPTAEYLTEEIRGLRSRIRRRESEVHEIEG